MIIDKVPADSFTMNYFRFGSGDRASTGSPVRGCKKRRYAECSANRPGKRGSASPYR